MAKRSLALALLFSAVAAGYYMLGGFNPVVIELKECRTIRLAGLYFEGTPQDERLGESFRSVEWLISGSPGSILHTIYYEEPAGKRDTMRVFVGTDAAADLPIGFDQLEVPCNQVVVAEINAHRFVMPSPVKVKDKIMAFAEDNGLMLQDVFIDRIIGADRVQVWAPLKSMD
ncbi:hypothetical protein ADIS_3993 [Lunatimonas lonarensis]|uniref:Uncharacterized protein n=1 Tax=Lunatimonas lonarensis TaxID=1232681 RepID=R7ZNC5_9BACT|nr:hypothetical protein [Lunatimonas lonarensis]EON75590.1 hypothetical protein ADIS_3993 [Lunatimonas lonarensis]